MLNFKEIELRKKRHWFGYVRAVRRVMLDETPLSHLMKWAENARLLTEAELDYAAALGQEIIYKTSTTKYKQYIHSNTYQQQMANQ